MLDRATRLAAALKRSPAERAKVVRDLIVKVVIDENTITIRVQRGPLLGGVIVPPSLENPSDSPIELTAPVAFWRHGVENETGAAGGGNTQRPLAMRSHADQGDRARARVVRGAC